MSAVGQLTIGNNDLWWLREGDGAHGDALGAVGGLGVVGAETLLGQRILSLLKAGGLLK